MKNSVKLIREDDNTAVFGGYGVVFDTVDLEGDTFTADTDYMLDLVPVKLAFVDHSLSTEFVNDEGKTVKIAAIDDPVGEVIRVTPDNVGLYMEMQIEKSNQYWAIVDQLHKSQKMGLSSGAIQHLVRRDGGKITRWPIVEESFTLTPAEPKTVGVERLKQLSSSYPDLKHLLPEGDQEIAGSGGDGRIQITDEDNTMSEETTQDVVTPDADYVTKDELKAVSGKLDHLLAVMEKNGRIKDVGYIAPDDEETRPEVKSFGDFLLAVKNKNVKRLATVYKSFHTKDISADVGASGGYLVPREFHATLRQMQTQASQILARVTRQPVATDSGNFPALDYTVTPTAGSGQTAMAAGLSATATAPGGSYAEDQPTFKELTYVVRKEGFYVEVDNEVVADSPFAIESLLNTLAGITINSKLERHIIRGSGAGEPLGILNSGVAVAQTTATDNVFAVADAGGMISKFKNVSGQQPVWIIHPSVWADILAFETSAGGGVFQACVCICRNVA